MVPTADSSFNFGSSSFEWLNVYTKNVTINDILLSRTNIGAVDINGHFDPSTNSCTLGAFRAWNLLNVTSIISSTGLQFGCDIFASGTFNIGSSTTPWNSIYCNNGFKPGGGSWSTFSDIRLKNSIEPFTEGLNILLKIKPKKFFYDESIVKKTDKKYVGIIAQELLNIYPNAITGSEEEFYKYDSSDLLYIAINAIKELHEQIQVLMKKK
jgi:hypothetical protein